jgi:hypothetical protein
MPIFCDDSHGGCVGLDWAARAVPSPSPQCVIKAMQPGNMQTSSRAPNEVQSLLLCSTQSRAPPPEGAQRTLQASLAVGSLSHAYSGLITVPPCEYAIYPEGRTILRTQQQACSFQGNKISRSVTRSGSTPRGTSLSAPLRDRQVSGPTFWRPPRSCAGRCGPGDPPPFPHTIVSAACDGPVGNHPATSDTLLGAPTRGSNRLAVPPPLAYILVSRHSVVPTFLTAIQPCGHLPTPRRYWVPLVLAPPSLSLAPITPHLPLAPVEIRLHVRIPRRRAHETGPGNSGLANHVGQHHGLVLPPARSSFQRAHL